MTTLIISEGRYKNVHRHMKRKAEALWDIASGLHECLELTMNRQAKLTLRSFGKDTIKLELPNITGVNAEWYIRCGK
jgi:hypothetical protein